MAHDIIMQAFERSSPHNVSLRSYHDYVEQFNIQEAIQWLEKSFAEVKECRNKINNKGDDLGEDSNKVDHDENEDYLDQDNDSNDADIDQEDFVQNNDNEHKDVIGND